jgi:hypothetical protein
MKEYTFFFKMFEQDGSIMIFWHSMSQPQENKCKSTNFPTALLYSLETA